MLVIQTLGAPGRLADWHCCSSHGAANILSSFSPFSSSSIGDPAHIPVVGFKHSPLYLSCSGRASQETATSGSCQYALLGIYNSVCFWWLYMGLIPRWGSLWTAFPLVSAPHFVSVTPLMGILFPLLRRIKESTLSIFFLSFMCFANCILGILSFWANIHLSVSAYQVTSLVTGLPHSGWYPPVTSSCLRIS